MPAQNRAECLEEECLSQFWGVTKLLSPSAQGLYRIKVGSFTAVDSTRCRGDIDTEDD